MCRLLVLLPLLIACSASPPVLSVASLDVPTFPLVDLPELPLPPSSGATIGDVLSVSSLGAPVDKIHGIAIDEPANRLYVLNRKSATRYRIEVFAASVSDATSRLALAPLPAESFDVPSHGATAFVAGRGLALANEGGDKVLYTLSSQDDDGDGEFGSSAWRIRLRDRATWVIDLGAAPFGLRGAEVFSVAADTRGRLLVTFDASHGLAMPNRSQGDAERVARGVRRFTVYGECAPSAEWADRSINCHLSWAIEGASALRRKMLPDNGRIEINGHDGTDASRTHFLSYGIATMPFPGAPGVEYLFLTAQEKIVPGQAAASYKKTRWQRIYAADGETARGLFSFLMPKRNGATSDAPHVVRYLSYGFGSLWAASSDTGTVGELLRIEVLNYEKARLGPRHIRHVELSLQSNSKNSGCTTNCGTIEHHLARPHSKDKRPHQDVYLPSETLTSKTYDRQTGLETNGAPAVETIRNYDPMDDAAERQHYANFRWATTNNNTNYRSLYDIDVWHASYYPYVYPHVVKDDAAYRAAFAGTDMEPLDPPVDDVSLYDVTHHGADYAGYVARAVDYAEAKYGGPVDMTNPYWAARNLIEYSREHYSYPGHGVAATSAPDKGHTESGPGWFKAVGSAPGWDPRITEQGTIDNVNMCVSGSIMMNGVFRSLGLPARGE